ncbi:MAG: N-acetylmuramoyl-L-alanine amidase, partial [Campylobacterales bacterium]
EKSSKGVKGSKGMENGGELSREEVGISPSSSNGGGDWEGNGAVGFGKVLKSWPEILVAFPNPIQVRHFQITGPKFKEVFDLTPAKVEKPYFKTLPNRIRLKVAQFKPGVVRVVLEGKEKFKLYSRIGEGVLELGFKPFKKKLKKSPLLKSSSEEEVKNYQEMPLAKKLTKAQKKGKVIVIDPGHGGKDPGGVGYRKIKEKEIVLRISKYLAQILRKRGYQVYLTRARDRFIQLKERTRFANQKKADLFISIHGNIAYHHNPRLRGIEVYYLSPTKNERAIRVAMEENKEIKGLNYLDQRVILNFLNKDRIVASHKFGIDVLNGIYNALRKRYPIRKNGVRGGPFWVLVGTQMPSILVEVGYLTNPTDAKLLKNPKFQQRLAVGIADGIEAYFRKNR